jgi:Uma2 family endonuclease
MATAAKPLLMTVDEYRQLPDKPGVVQELHWGQVVTLSHPKPRHVKLQSRVTRLLRPIAEHLGYVETELPFRALPEYDLRAADVAFITRERWDSVGEEDLAGSPELVIEVLSPSNTRSKIQAMAALCLATGTEEFWVVDAKRKTVSVTPRAGNTVVYSINDTIPLRMFNSELKVSEIFG